jgi:hypothetical protein
VSDKNGKMLGFNVTNAGKGDVKLRFVYEGGTVMHVMPGRVAASLLRDMGKVKEVLRGKRREWRVGDWAGPE